VFYEYLTYVLFNQIWFPFEKCFFDLFNLVYVSNIINGSEARWILVYINKYNYICYIVDFRCCCRYVVVVQVEECVINDLGTVVIVVVVVVELYADIHIKSFILMHCWGFMPWNFNHSTVEGLCPGMLVHSNVEGLCPGML